MIIIILLYCKKSYYRNNFDNLVDSSFCYYVLNLERSIERKERCNKEFSKYNIDNYTYVKGIDSKHYLNKEDMLKKNNHKEICMNGLNHIGCYLSHVKGIKEFYDSNYEFGIILEDDFEFIENPTSHILKYIKYLQKSVDIVILSSTAKNKKVVEIFGVPTWNAVGYIINKKAAKILITTLTPGSNFLIKNYKNSDCLYDFALFKTVVQNIKYKWFSLVKQRLEEVSTITNVANSIRHIDNFYINATEYKFDKCEHAVNLGDSASQQFIEDLCKVKFGTKKTKGCVITIGSILTYARKNTVVWGSGFLNKGEKMIYGFDKICSVRGPKSYKNLIDSGIKCPQVFGDPFFIVPLLYTPKNKKFYELEKNYDIGIIPHYMEKDSKDLTNYIKQCTEKYKTDKIKIIDIQTNNIQQFINDISECSEIHSSSLHGIIISLAYFIPTKWIRLSNKTGDGFKYYDFFESLKIDYKDEEIIYINENLYISDVFNLGVEIITSCPFMKKEMKTDYINKWDLYCNDNIK